MSNNRRPPPRPGSPRQRARDRGAEPVGPLVAVHRGVQAAGLLQVDLGGPGGLQAVEADRLGGEEAERVEVGAADGAVFNDRIGAGRAEP